MHKGRGPQRMPALSAYKEVESMKLSKFFYEAALAAHKRRDYRGLYKMTMWVRWFKRTEEYHEQQRHRQ